MSEHRMEGHDDKPLIPSTPPVRPEDEATAKAETPYRSIVHLVCDQSNLVTDDVGELSGGRRLHVTYSGGTVQIGSGAHVLNGQVESGTDWLLVRSNGSVVFDARLTFRINANENFVFDALLTGVADLAPSDCGPEERSQVYKEWAKRARTTTSVALPVVIEVGTRDEPWISKKFGVLSRSKAFKALAPLLVTQCVARGKVTFDQGKLTGVDLSFKVLELDAQKSKAELVNRGEGTSQPCAAPTSMPTNDPVLNDGIGSTSTPQQTSSGELS